MASNINSSNAVNRKPVSKSRQYHKQHSTSTTATSRTQQQQQQQQQQRRSSQQQNRPLQQQQSLDDPAFHSATTCVVPSAAAGANFPPGSPEDTLNPETRTAQWILNNISKQQGREPRPEIAYPSAPADVSVVPERSPVPAVKESSSRSKAKSPFVADIAAVKTTAHNPHPSYMERITSLETDVVTLQSQLKEKNIQFSELRSAEKRLIRTGEKLRASVDQLKDQLEVELRNRSEADSREFTLRHEVHVLQTSIVNRNNLLRTKDDVIKGLQNKIAHLQPNLQPLDHHQQQRH